MRPSRVRYGNTHARERWERAADWPLTLVAAVFLAAYAWPILDPRLPDTWTRACSVVTWLAWGAFAADYLMRLALSPDPRDFVRHPLVDLGVIFLPMLRPLRLLRLVTLL